MGFKLHIEVYSTGNIQTYFKYFIVLSGTGTSGRQNYIKRKLVLNLVKDHRSMTSTVENVWTWIRVKNVESSVDIITAS